MKYNRYMTDDRNRKFGNPVYKFFFMINAKMKPYIIFGAENQNIVYIIKKITLNIYMNIQYQKNVIIKVVRKHPYIITH